MAREVRPDPRPSPKPGLGCAWALFCVVLIVVDICLTEPDAPGPMRTVGAAGLLVSLLRLLFRPYRCPECGDRLKMIRLASPDGGDEGPIHHDCPRCDVEWDAGDLWSRGGSD